MSKYHKGATVYPWVLCIWSSGNHLGQLGSVWVTSRRKEIGDVCGEPLGSLWEVPERFLGKTLGALATLSFPRRLEKSQTNNCNQYLETKIKQNLLYFYDLCLQVGVPLYLFPLGILRPDSQPASTDTGRALYQHRQKPYS